MKNKILHSIDESLSTLTSLKESQNLLFIEKAATMIVDCFQKGGKLLLAGNGGSLCDAAHFAEELTGIFRKERKPLPALVLSEVGHITCVANDLGYEKVFSRGVEAFGKQGDIFIGMTTSGNSPNLCFAFEKARHCGLETIAFLGRGGGKLKGFADLELTINGPSTSDRIQEVHMAAIHILIEIIEELLFYAPKSQEAVPNPFSYALK